MEKYFSTEILTYVLVNSIIFFFMYVIVFNISNRFIEKKKTFKEIIKTAAIFTLFMSVFYFIRKVFF